MQMFEPEDTSMYAGVIYGLHNGDRDFRYIGKTIQTARKRFIAHRKDANSGKARPVCRWMRKHGIDNIQMEIIETFTKEDVHLIDEREIFHIANARATSIRKNLNVTDGGDGGMWSAEAKARLSLSRTGKPCLEETKKKIGDANRGRPNWNKGGTISEEQKQWLSNERKGKPNYGSHVRWHVNRGTTKTECVYCPT